MFTRKYFVFILMIILSLSIFTSCSSANPPQNAENKVDKKNQTVADKTNGQTKDKTEGEKSNLENSRANQTPKGNSFSDRDSVSGKEVTGTFQMKFENDDLEATNEIKISALGQGKLMVSFNLGYPFRLNNERTLLNVGRAQGEASIKGDTAIYSTKDEYGWCEITIRFVKPGLIKVFQKQEGSGCGFGLNVSAHGTYKKVSDKKPTFNQEN